DPVFCKDGRPIAASIFATPYSSVAVGDIDPIWSERVNGQAPVDAVVVEIGWEVGRTPTLSKKLPTILAFGFCGCARQAKEQRRGENRKRSAQRPQREPLRRGPWSSDGYFHG